MENDVQSSRCASLCSALPKVRQLEWLAVRSECGRFDFLHGWAGVVSAAVISPKRYDGTGGYTVDFFCGAFRLHVAEGEDPKRIAQDEFTAFVLSLLEPNVSGHPLRTGDDDNGK